MHIELGLEETDERAPQCASCNRGNHKHDKIKRTRNKDKMPDNRGEKSAHEHLPGRADIEKPRFVRERKRKSREHKRSRGRKGVSDSLAVHQRALQNIGVGLKRILPDKKHEKSACDKPQNYRAQGNQKRSALLLLFICFC